MNKLNQKAELAANILIITAAVLLIGVVVQKYFFSAAAANQQARAQPTVGSKLNVTDVNFSGYPKMLVLALQTGCHFCNESAPFYKRLIEETKGKNIKLVAVFPQSVEEGTAHLNQLGLTGMEVRSSPLNNIQVSGTPTLILTNEN
ncbi:MAG: hypothetical protein ACR2N3_07820 [Pyrinomonadaceae bacterium]